MRGVSVAVTTVILGATFIASYFLKAAQQSLNTSGDTC